jgi:Ni/Co efflux regulator RcnB
MKKTLIAVAAALLFGGGFSASALAQSYGGHDRDGHHDSRGSDDHRDGDRRGDDRHDGDRHDNDRHDGDRHGDNRGGHDGRGDRYDHGGGYDPDRDRRHDGRDDRNGRWDNRNHMAHQRYHGGRYVEPRYFRYSRYDIGSRLPVGYYGNSYYIDYRPYGLMAPPRGYRWNRVGNDVYLISIADGLVRDVIYSLFY